MRLEKFQCQICGGYFERNLDSVVGCAVAHSYGSCCHYGQRPLEQTEIEAADLVEEPLDVWRQALGL